ARAGQVLVYIVGCPPLTNTRAFEQPLPRPTAPATGQSHGACARAILPLSVLRETRAELAIAREAGGGEGLPRALSNGPHPSPLPAYREGGQALTCDSPGSCNRPAAGGY